MSRSVKTGGVLVGFGVLLSQLGHLLVYQLQFGSGAQAVQSSGAHAYFPAFAKTSAGLAAAGVLVSLLIIGAARLATGRPVRALRGGPTYMRLLGALFTIQLVAFAIQETAESIAAGAAIPTAPHLLLLGTVGQLPVAALAALALKWVLVRIESAVLDLRTAVASTRFVIATLPSELLPRVVSLEPALVEACPAAYIKRGPPPSLRSQLS
ncbi:MAG: hypothetical protein ACHQ0J_14075 [Candidatus Dormibacterales bacterium]